MSARGLRWIARLGTTAIIVVLTLVGIEIGLRLAPGLIPEDLLKRFEPTARLAASPSSKPTTLMVSD